MKFVGAHISTAGGVSHAPANATAIGAKAFAMFTRNPSRWTSPPITDRQAQEFKANCLAAGFTPDRILPHDSYLINLGAPDPAKLEMSRTAFVDELRRCEQLGLTMLNFHPGAPLRMMDDDACLDLIAESINLALQTVGGVIAVIENTAGQGSNLGFTFEQIARIIHGVDDQSRIGVCIDTCHAFAGGYDLSTDLGYEQTWQQFERIIGWDKLRGMHLNDSVRDCASHVDRHAPLGAGRIGRRFFERLMADPHFDNIPLILETPDPDLWPDEIKWLESLIP